jgi:hypothetical protein
MPVVGFGQHMIAAAQSHMAVFDRLVRPYRESPALLGRQRLGRGGLDLFGDQPGPGGQTMGDAPPPFSGMNSKSSRR